jgi:hypothetical protein
MSFFDHAQSIMENSYCFLTCFICNNNDLIAQQAHYIHEKAHEGGFIEKAVLSAL